MVEDFDDDDIAELFLRLNAAEDEIKRLKLLTSQLTLLGRPSGPTPVTKRDKPVPQLMDLSKIVPFRKQTSATGRLGSSERTGEIQEH